MHNVDVSVSFLEAINKTSPVVDGVYVPIIHAGVVQANQNIPQHRTSLTKDIEIFMERYAFELLLSCCLCKEGYVSYCGHFVEFTNHIKVLYYYIKFSKFVPHSAV